MKMAQLNAYVRFNGDCREAFEFYQSCFGGDLTDKFGISWMLQFGMS